MRKLSTLSLLVAAGIALNACGDTSDSSTPASEASADSQLTSVVAPVTASTSEAPEDSGPAPTLNDAPSGTPAADDNANPNPGGHNINVGQVGGACGYTNQGDKIHAGENTSCEFAAAMFDLVAAQFYREWLLQHPHFCSEPGDKAELRPVLRHGL